MNTRIVPDKHKKERPTKWWRTVRGIACIIGLLCLVGFYTFSREVKHGFLKQTDFNTTVRIQDKVPKKLDSEWEDIAFFVTPGPSIFVVGLLTVVALVDIKRKKIRPIALLIPLFFGFLICGEIYGKSVVHHPSPPFFMIKNPTSIFPKYYVNEQYSYPSGHTARAVFIVTIILAIVTSLYNIRTRLDVYKNKKYMAAIVLGILYVASVAIGRIDLGHHWLSDVIGGTLLGGSMGAFIFGLLYVQ